MVADKGVIDWKSGEQTGRYWPTIDCIGQSELQSTRAAKTSILECLSQC